MPGAAQDARDELVLKNKKKVKQQNKTKKLYPMFIKVLFHHKKSKTISHISSIWVFDWKESNHKEQ